MRHVRFYQSADEVAGADIAESIAVVADVLRATSTIVTALANGCEKVLPVEKVEEARKAAEQFPREKIILGGERKGKKIDGFDFGNSPQDYTPQAVENKIVITTTTNGTKALVYSGKAEQSLVLSFLNLSAIADYMLRQTNDVALIAAGIYGDFSVEDSVCCGLLLQKLVESAPGNFTLDEKTTQVLKLAQQYIGRIDVLLQTSPHGDFLRKINYESDLAVCARLDSHQIVPVYEDGFVEIIERY
jgi:2-phosphosulfolactate phosphatase